MSQQKSGRTRLGRWLLITLCSVNLVFLVIVGWLLKTNETNEAIQAAQKFVRELSPITEEATFPQSAKAYLVTYTNKKGHSAWTVSSYLETKKHVRVEWHVEMTLELVPKNDNGKRTIWVLRHIEIDPAKI